jgi:hypothetical protein
MRVPLRGGALTLADDRERVAHRSIDLAVTREQDAALPLGLRATLEGRGQLVMQ